jgi:hypothetical protein
MCLSRSAMPVVSWVSGTVMVTKVPSSATFILLLRPSMRKPRGPMARKVAKVSVGFASFASASAGRNAREQKRARR